MPQTIISTCQGPYISGPSASVFLSADCRGRLFVDLLDDIRACSNPPPPKDGEKKRALYYLGVRFGITVPRPPPQKKNKNKNT